MKTRRKKNELKEEIKYYRYTDKYIKKIKFLRIFLFFGFFAGLILAKLIESYSTYLSIVLFSIIVIFEFKLAIELVSRNIYLENLYIKNGLITLEKYYGSRVGSSLVITTINQINKLIVEKNKIKIYGEIIIDNFSGMKVKRKKLVLPTEIKGVEELIEYMEIKYLKIKKKKPNRPVT